MYDNIKAKCLQLKETSPIKILASLMNDKEIAMHGPIHHILDGMALLTAMHNANVKFDLSSALDEMIERGSKMPGATCGKWGMCGSASSIGAALSIVNNVGPLSCDENYKNNLELVSMVLMEISKIGGPRCCKRNAFISLSVATKFLKERYDIALSQVKVKCGYSPKNQQCIKGRCPFYNQK